MCNKLKSRRFIAALWAMALISAIVFLDRKDFAGLTTALAGVVGIWIGSETITKRSYLEGRKDDQ